MEAIQLQPVRANIIYPNRVNRTLKISQYDITDAEPILSRREVKNFLLLKPIQRK